MANAQQRNDKQRRTNLLERLGEVDRDKLVEYVKAENLPKSTKDWTLEQIDAAVHALHVSKKGETPAAKAPKKQVHYSIQYRASEPPEQVKVFALSSRELADKATNSVGEGMTGHSVSVADDLKSVPTPVMLAIVNKTKDTAVTRYASKELAMEATFNALSRASEETVAKTPKKEKAAPAEPRAAKPVAYEPKAAGDIKQVREGTKVATMIDMLAKGTTIAELEKALSATGKPVSARAWLGYDLNKVAGYGVRQDEDGTLHLVLPKGMKAPLAHKVPEEKKPAPAQKKAKKAEAPAEEQPAPEPASVNEDTPATEGSAPEPVKAAAKKAPAKKAAAKKAKK